jgi:hypothetical protein
MPGDLVGQPRRSEPFDRPANGLSRPNVLATRAAFAERGTAGICAPQRRKRSRRVLTPELEQQILGTTLKTRPAEATHWSARVLAAKLGVSRMMVQRVWLCYDVQPHRVEKFKISSDPKFEDKVRDMKIKGKSYCADKTKAIENNTA